MLTGDTVSHEVTQITDEAVKVAEQIATSEPFNYHAAGVSLGTLAALFNQGTGTMNSSILEQLGPAVSQSLAELASGSYGLLDSRNQALVQDSTMAAQRAGHDSRVALLQSSFNVFYEAIGHGPYTEDLAGFGYNPNQEPAIRDMVRAYANTFARLYQGLYIIGHSLATDRGSLSYFASRIRGSAIPEREDPIAPAAEDRPDSEYPDVEDPSDYI